jgi:hypothetical protein
MLIRYPPDLILQQAGDENRTRVTCLEGKRSTIELLPHSAAYYSPARLAVSRKNTVTEISTPASVSIEE